MTGTNLDIHMECLAKYCWISALECVTIIRHISQAISRHLVEGLAPMKNRKYAIRWLGSRMSCGIMLRA